MTERWVKQATKMATDGWSGDSWAVSISDTVKLLARQHRAAVNKVKAMLKEVEHVKDTAHFVRGERHAYQQVLAALAKQGGK